MANLTRAHDELFRRSPDEQFPSLHALVEHCKYEKENAIERWELPQSLRPAVGGSRENLIVAVGNDGDFLMNDWSFGQLCRLGGVKKDTVNRLSPDTAKRVFYETLPNGNKPLQLLTNESRVRSIHQASYTRLYNADLLSIVEEFANDFQPPQKAADRSTGLYYGEQDMFVFLIDPTGWAEINGEAFAPGFFLWKCYS